jgi:hypothetical protein
MERVLVGGAGLVSCLLQYGKAKFTSRRKMRRTEHRSSRGTSMIRVTAVLVFLELLGRLSLQAVAQEELREI